MQEKVCRSIVIFLTCFFHCGGTLLEGDINKGEVLLVSGENGELLTFSAVIGAAIITMAMSLLGIYLLILALEDDNEVIYDHHRNPGRSEGLDNNHLLTPSKVSSDITKCIQMMICDLVANNADLDYTADTFPIRKSFFPKSYHSIFTDAVKFGGTVKHKTPCHTRYSCMINTTGIYEKVHRAYKYYSSGNNKI